MFKGIKGFVSGNTCLKVDNSGEPTTNDVLIATGVLLLQVAGSDEDYAPEEVGSIYRTMGEQYSIENSDVLEILEHADELRQAHGKIDEFIKAINDSFSDKQKVKVLAMVWKVVLADGQVEKYERRMATQFKTRLQLSDEQFEEARRLGETGAV